MTAEKICSRCGRAGTLHREDEVVVSCQLARLRADLLAATHFQFFGAGGRRGDYVLVCFNDEEEDRPWEIQVFTCEKSSPFGSDLKTFRTQSEATNEALLLAATLTKRPTPPSAAGGLVPRDEARRGSR